MQRTDYCDAYDLRTPTEKARTVLFEHLNALAQYIANDPSPSVFDRFEMLQLVTSAANWQTPRVAAERIQTVLSARRDSRLYVAYLGQALAAIEKYARVSGAEGEPPSVVERNPESAGNRLHPNTAAGGVR